MVDDRTSRGRWRRPVEAGRLFRCAAVGLLLLCGIALSGPRPAFGQQQFNVAIIGLTEIMRECAAAKVVLAEIQKRENALKAEVEKRENALLAMDQQLAQQRNSLSAEEFAQKRAQLSQQAAEVRKYAQNEQAEIAALARQGELKIRNVLRKIVEEIAKERSIMLVLNKSQVLLAPEQIDITAEAMSRLDRELPTVSLTE